MCQYSEIIYVACDHEDFTKKVGIALSEEHDVEKLKAVARANDWKPKDKTDGGYYQRASC